MLTVISGNIDAILQQISGSTVNEIGERIPTWEDAHHIRGWLDWSSGNSQYTYDTKLQESTHIFLCDYVALDRKPAGKRLIVGGKVYDVILIDDPMELHQQLEIYLKYVGDVDA